MLTTLLVVPLVAGLLCLFAPRRIGAVISILGAAVTLGLAVAIVAGFDGGASGLQYAVDAEWIPALGISYSLGVDGVSVFLVALTALLWLAGTVWSAMRLPDGKGRAGLYLFLLGLGETATLGAFLAQDLLLFVLFFDLMLIPFFLLIGAFGRRVSEPAPGGGSIIEINPSSATIKMIVYTLAGSLLMLVGAIATAVLAADGGQISFAMADLRENILSEGSQAWIFWLFAAAFLVKMPAFPIHGWMPDAYRACPLPVLVLLSGVLSKVGAYGFIRVVLPTFPDASVQFQDVMLVIGVISILYGSAMAFTQTNIRLIAGYSSVAQLGFITIGIFALTPDAIGGSILQMVNHGLVVAPVFLIAAVLYARSGTEDITKMGGLAKRAPILAGLFLVVTMALLAIPGSANFIGEFFILNGLFETKVAFAVVASVGIALAAFYALRMYQRTMHNPLPEGMVSREIEWREALVIVPLVGVIIALALYPGLVIERSEATVGGGVEAVAAAADRAGETTVAEAAVR
ncbi:NADH-quinone oxidoreductase subunit M [Thermoleophilia bacterium SCSIO 60948]|nr:NADH-quinone oxidoreductase subunit M [Thermoleophilia bacterium SCSIO 60948]